MKKSRVLLTLLVGALVSGISCVTPYHGGQGSGHDMAEYTGRIDCSDVEHQENQAENATAYHGGPGAGYDMAEYTGRIDCSD